MICICQKLLQFNQLCTITEPSLQVPSKHKSHSCFIMLEFTYLLALFSNCWVFAGLTESSAHGSEPYLKGFIKRQTFNGTLPDCHLYYSTDVWTGCAQVLTQFNVSFEYFQYANPNISANCANFVPGGIYCIHRGKKLSLLYGRMLILRSLWLIDQCLIERTLRYPAELDEYLCG